uniref:Uncharacterized protein n=1 Tax=Arundo donax TaxID=35708 RepID=A0A0A9BW10_ARUDO
MMLFISLFLARERLPQQHAAAA